MPFKTTKAIKSLANGGVNLRARQHVTPAAFTPELWGRLLDDGAIVEIVPPAPPIPEPDDEPEPETAVSLDALNIDQLKALADENGVPYTWNIKAETLRERLNDALS